MADFLKWNRPEEQGVQTPSFFIDPSTYVGGGIGGLISKLASRGAGKVLQHGAIVGTGKVAPVAKDLLAADRIASLNRAASLYKGLNQLMEKAGWTYRIGE